MKIIYKVLNYKLKKNLKKSYCNLVFDNNIPVKVDMYCSISHSAENTEKIEEQTYIFRRTGRYLVEDERIRREEEEDSEEDSEEEEERNKQINTDKSFKSDECVIYLTNPPSVLFCNCGHISVCAECDKVKSLNTCPVCKTETTIKRTIEY